MNAKQLCARCKSHFEKEREESRQREIRSRVWNEDLIDDARACELLTQVGAEIAGIKKGDSLPEFGTNPELEVGLIRLIAYFRNLETIKESLKSAPPILHVAKSIWPGALNSEIRSSRIGKPESYVATEVLELSDWGGYLESYAEDLTAGDESRMELLATRAIPALDDDRLTGCCVEFPVEVSHLVSLLDGAIHAACPSPETMPKINRWVIILVGILVTVVVGQPWNIGHRSSIHSASSMIIPMAGLAAIASAICDAISGSLAPQMNVYTIAQAKTLNKVNAAILAMESIFFGVGISADKSGTVSIVFIMVFYILVVMMTISSDQMINIGEARMKEE